MLLLKLIDCITKMRLLIILIRFVWLCYMKSYHDSSHTYVDNAVCSGITGR